MEEDSSTSVFKRFFRNACCIPAWFAPHKRMRAFFHRLKGVKIGKNVEIGYFVFFDNRRPELITVEDRAIVASKSVILSHDFSYKYIDGKERVAPVRIKEKAFVGFCSIILPGVTIGKNSIVGAGSVVTKDVPDNSLVVGVPAKKIRDLEVSL